jgi:hypothetical protein
MKQFWLLMILAAFAFPLAGCSGGEAEEGGTDNGGVEGTEEGAGGEEGAGAEEASMNSGAGVDEVAAVCCGGGCDAPAGYCCSDGTCNGNHAELPIHTS